MKMDGAAEETPEERRRRKNREYSKAWRDRNPEGGRAATRRWREKNAEYHAAQNKRRAREWRQKNPEKARALGRSWAARNKDKVRRSAAASAKRRWKKLRANWHAYQARIRNAPGAGVTSAQWREILDSTAGLCSYCGARPERLSMDHIDPLTLGGAHDPDNLAPCCGSCNSSKHNTPLLLWLALRPRPSATP